MFQKFFQTYTETAQSESYFADDKCSNEEVIEFLLKEAGAPSYACPVCGLADVRNLAPHIQTNHNDIQVQADTAQKLLSKYENVIKKWKVLNHFVDSLKKKNTPAFNYHYMRYTNYKENYYQLSEMNKPAFGISPFPGDLFNSI